MLRVFATVRPAERRDTWAAFFTLFGFIVWARSRRRKPSVETLFPDPTLHN